MAVQALLIDLDGTLSDSLYALKVAYEQFLKLYGVRGCAAEFRSLNGPPLTNIVSYLKSTYNLEPNVEYLFEQYIDIVRQNLSLAKPNPGARCFLERVRKNKTKVGVVSSSLNFDVVSWLRRNQLIEFVNIVVGGDDVPVGKPDPTPYLAALSKLNCAAEETVAVEDSLMGATSSQAAKIKTYVYRPFEKLDFENRGLILIENFDEIGEFI